MTPHELTASVWQRSKDNLLQAIVSVDGIRAVLKFKPDAVPLIDHPDLVFVQSVNTKTGEDYGLIAKYKGLRFTIQGGTHFLLRGSLHRFANNGLHNADHFIYEKLLYALDQLEKRFGICLETSRLENLESGVNLFKYLNLKAIMDGLLMQGHKRIKDMHIAQGDFHGAEYDLYFSAYYDKGMQYPDYKGTFRIEVKFRKSKAFKDTGILTLARLKNPFCLLLLAEKVDMLWNKDTLFFDRSLLQKQADFKPKEWERLQQWLHPQYWEQLFELKKGGDGYRTEWKRFEKLQAKHSGLKREISEAIAQKWKGLREFTSTHPEKAGNFTPPFIDFQIEELSQQQGKITGGTSSIGGTEYGEIHSLIHSLSKCGEFPVSQSSGLDSLTREQLFDALGMDENDPY
jgi:hypothetical protein